MAGLSLGEFGVSEESFGLKHAQAMWDWMMTQNPSDDTKELFGEGLYLNAIPLVNTHFDLLTPWQQVEYLHEIIFKALEYYGKNKTRDSFAEKFPARPESQQEAQKLWGHIRWKLKNECNEIGRIYNRRKLRHERLEQAGARFGFDIMPLRRQDLRSGVQVSYVALLEAQGHSKVAEDPRSFSGIFNKTQEMSS